MSRNTRLIPSTKVQELVASAEPMIDAPAFRQGRHRRSGVAESFRHARANITFRLGNPVGSLAVTSCLSGEGRTTAAIFLALCFAESGQQVLLVDGDLRRPGLAGQFGVAGSAGLVNVLDGGTPVGNVIQPEIRPNLALLPAGPVPPDPGGLLAGKALGDALTVARRRYQVIIIDTPALLAAADGALVAACADHALLVAKQGRATAAQITLGVSVLAKTGTPLLGSIFGSDARPTTSGADFQYGYYTDSAKTTDSMVPDRHDLQFPARTTGQPKSRAVGGGAPLVIDERG